MAATKRNNSIDIFRYVCAVLVVNIHGHPLSSFSSVADSIFLNYVARIAVPYFFVVAGYYYSKRRYAGKNIFAAYMKKQFLVYLLWSVIFAVYRIILCGGADWQLVSAMLLEFCYWGVSSHLWFCLSLMVAVCVLELALRFHKEQVLLGVSLVLFTVGCCGSAYYYLIGDKIPGLNWLYAQDCYVSVQRLAIYGITFVTLGNYIARNEERLLRHTNRQQAWLLTAAAAAFIAERILTAALHWSGGTLYSFALWPLMLTLLVLLLKNPAPRRATAAAYLGFASSLMYYMHPIWLGIAQYFIWTAYGRFLFAVAMCTAFAFAIVAVRRHRAKRRAAELTKPAD